MPLRLRPYVLADERAALTVAEALRADQFTFLLGYEPTDEWASFVAKIDDQRRGVGVRPDMVRAAQLVADFDGVLVGRASIRFSLNEFLATRGGHIGYGVAPQFRGRGFATEILRQALVLARSEGVNEVLMVCDDDNIASAKVIERCGGVLESVVAASGDEPAYRRYWIN